MLAPACKTGEQFSIKKVVTPYIRKAYGAEEADKVAAALTEMDALRLGAVTATGPTEDAAEAISKYLEKLEYLAHFPFGSKQLKTSFTWFSAYNPKAKSVLPDIHLDKIALTYNLGVITIRLASKVDFTTTAGLKECGRLMRRAAGYFSIARELSFSKTFPTTFDVEVESLDVLTQLALAQAQECMWMTAVMDNMNPTIIASVAIWIAETYDRMIASMDVKAYRKEWPKEWLSVFRFKSAMLKAEAHFRAGMSDQAKKNWGIAIAQLQWADNLITETMKGSTKGVPPTFLSFIQRNTVSTIKRELPTMIKDNQLIYHASVPTGTQSVPSSRQLATPDKPEMVEHFMNDPGDPFRNLIPGDVKQFLEAYITKADAALDAALGPVKAVPIRIQKELSDRGLPQSLWAVLPAEATEDGAPGSDVPTSLEGVLNQLRAAGGPQSIESRRDSNARIAEEARNSIQSSILLLRNAFQQDTQYVQQFGARWNSAVFRTMYAQYMQELDTLSTKLGQALSTDMIVNQKISAFSAPIQTAWQYAVDHERIKEEAKTPDGPLVQAAQAVKAQIDALQAVKARALELENQLHQIRTQDNPIQDLLECKGMRESDPKVQKVFERNLAQYSAAGSGISEIQSELDAAVSQLNAANAAFIGAKHTSGAAASLEQQLAQVQVGLSAFNELRQALDNGEKFYSELQRRVRSLDGRCRAFTESFMDEALMGLRLLTSGTTALVNITGTSGGSGAGSGAGSGSGPGASPGAGPGAPSAPPPPSAPAGGAPAQPPAQPMPPMQPMQPMQPTQPGYGYGYMPPSQQQPMPPGYPAGGMPMGYMPQPGYPPQPGAYGVPPQGAYGHPPQGGYR